MTNKEKILERFEKQFIGGIYRSEEGGWGYNNNCKDEIKNFLSQSLDEAFEEGKILGIDKYKNELESFIKDKKEKLWSDDDVLYSVRRNLSST